MRLLLEGAVGSVQKLKRRNKPNVAELGTRNLEPGTMNAEPGTRNREPGTVNPEPGTWNLEPGTWNLEPGTWNNVYLTSFHHSTR